MAQLKIVWTKQAKEALRSIYNYYKDKSPQGAKMSNQIYSTALKPYCLLNNTRLMK